MLRFYGLSSEKMGLGAVGGLGRLGLLSVVGVYSWAR